MFIDIRTFGGMRPYMGHHLLPGEESREAKNCRIASGELRPFAQTRKDHVVPTPKGSMYRHHGKWLHFQDAHRRFVPGPVFAESQRLYMSKELGGAEVYTSEQGTHILGVKEPTGAPVAQVTGSAGETPSSISRVYVFTCVSEIGEEGPPSPPSSIVTMQTGQSVELSGMVTPEHEGYIPITHKRIYRSTTGTKLTDYLLVAEIPASSTSYIDSVKDELLGESLPSMGWREPPKDLKGLCSLPGGILAGFSGSEVRLSEPFMPHAWPDRYAFTVEYPVVQIAATDRTLFILTAGPVYAMQVDDIDSAAPVAMEGEVPCLSGACVVETPSGVIFPSRDGLYLVSPGMPRAALFSGDFFRAPEWLALNPETMSGCWCGDVLYVFYRTDAEVRGGLILSMTDKSLVTTDAEIDSFCVVPDGERLFVEENGVCWEWDAHPLANMTASWTSKSHLLNNPTSFSFAMVEASIEDRRNTANNEELAEFKAFLELNGNTLFGATADKEVSEVAYASDLYQSNFIPRRGVPNIVVDFFADGRLVYSRNVGSRLPFPLPAGFTARTWSIRVRTNVTIRRIAMAESLSELYS